jgi:hypothetical protein
MNIMPFAMLRAVANNIPAQEIFIAFKKLWI